MKSSPVEREIALPQVGFEDHVIIGGFGRTGRAAANAFVAAQIPVLVIESNFDSMTDIANAGCMAIWGDIERDEILRAARVDRAKVLMLTMPNRNTIHIAIERARNANPSIPIVARALRDWHVDELRAQHVTAIQPEFEGGVEMVRQALVRLGREEDMEAITAQLRAQLYGDTGERRSLLS